MMFELTDLLAETNILRGAIIGAVIGGTVGLVFAIAKKFMAK